jgi:hypothetical protein
MDEKNDPKRDREKPSWEQIQRDRDEPVAIPLEPDEALNGLLKVDPESREAEDAPAPTRRED